MPEGLICAQTATVDLKILDTTGQDLSDTKWPVKELSISTTNNEENTKQASGALLGINFEKSDSQSTWQVLNSEKSISSKEKTVESQDVEETALTPPYSNNVSPQVKSDLSPSGDSSKELVQSTETQAEAVKPESLEPCQAHFGASEALSKRIHPEDTFYEKVEQVEMTKEQYKYALSMLRQLRRNKDARPFNQPVDPIKLNIPSYPTIITHPMDFGTIDKKLSSKQYETVEEFKKDVELVFTNCFTFNGEESPISIMAKNLKNIFGKQILQMPSVDYVPTPKPSKVRKKSLSSDTGLGGNSAIHRNSMVTDRPRREIHPPPPRDLPYNETKPHRRKNAAQLQFCRNVIRELQKKTHESYAFPFYRPVDPVALNIPDYYKIVKHPMDMSTIQGKLNNVYNTADEFESDIRQMFRNCYKFNPVGTPVYNMGKRLEAVFDKKWQEKPTEHHSYSSDESDTESDDVDDNEGIALLEKQLAMMSDQLNAMRNKRASLKTKNKSGKSKKGNSRKSGYRNEERLRILSFDQRSELAQKINLLTGSKLDTVLRIMKESMPELEDQTDEIELDIDSMTPRTQSRLWNFVILNQLPNTPIGPAKAKPIAPKKNRTVLSEAEQLRQIRHLERQLSRFEDKGNGKYISSNSGTEESSSETESSSAED
ncbi:hypothetical protein PNEG_00534 [Pneumocystis murina B123]|uniref:Bromo domain-containing protein n=1 Tax=Pneumocystis murina (strain B123) TaxID=1069680 RepID=M7NRZ3_PNEMU|nr:hypothetical protein PNEG_00534 [Pneumocystis murina B123]EMR11523.1 hypothetical protein PNEG_00534 [Pneumocystis murina B123]